MPPLEDSMQIQNTYVVYRTIYRFFGIRPSIKGEMDVYRNLYTIQDGCLSHGQVQIIPLISMTEMDTADTGICVSKSDTTFRHAAGYNR